MEINELIKSNIIFISLYAGVIILIALIIYLLRKKALSKIDTEQDAIDLDDSERIVSIQKPTDKAPPLNKDISNIFTESVKRKFVVINEMRKDKDHNNLKDRHKHECKEVYETTASKLMFKFNPRPEQTVEQ